jgi:hypothetical protein
MRRLRAVLEASLLVLANLIAALVFCLVASRCSHVPSTEFRSYRACEERTSGTGRLHNPGRVVGEFLDGSHSRWFQFVSDSNPDDGKHIQEIHKVNRFCPVLGPVRSLEMTPFRGAEVSQ